MHVIVVVVVVMCILLVGTTKGQNATNSFPIQVVAEFGMCEPIPADPSWGGPCRPLLASATHVYVATNYTLASLGDLANGIEAAAAITPPCGAAAVDILCLGALRPCMAITLDNTTYLVPQTACYDVCDAAVTECAGTLVQGVLANNFGNCIVVPGSDVPYTTVGKYYYDANATAFVNCSRPPENAHACTFLQVPTTTGTASTCSLVCDFPIFSWDADAAAQPTSKEHVFDKIGYVFASVSLLFATISTLSYMFLFPKATRYPTRYFIYINLCCIGVASAQLVSLGPATQVRCTNLYTAATGLSSRLCGLQGIALVVFFISSFYFWVLLSVSLHLMIVRGWTQRRLEEWKMIVVYKLVGWGLSVLLCVVAFSTGLISYSASMRTCFVTDDSESNYKIWGLVNVWLLLALAIGTPVTVSTLFRIRHELFVTRRALGVQVTKANTKIPFRMLYFAFYFNIYLLCFLIYQSFTSHLQSQLDADALAYTECVSSNYAKFSFGNNNNKGGAVCTVTSALKTSSYYAFAILYRILSCSQGLVCFFIVTNTPGNRAIWAKTLSAVGVNVRFGATSEDSASSTVSSPQQTKKRPESSAEVSVELEKRGAASQDTSSLENGGQSTPPSATKPKSFASFFLFGHNPSGSGNDTSSTGSAASTAPVMGRADDDNDVIVMQRNTPVDGGNQLAEDGVE